MINSGFYRNVNWYFTNEGRTTLAKQSSGIKFSKVGAVLFSDKNHALINAIKDNNTSVLNNITLKQLNTYTQLIFQNIKYTFEGGSYSSDQQDVINNTVNKCDLSKLLPIDISYERNAEQTYFSYDLTLKTDSLDIDKATSDDMNFDGFALLGIPFKSTLQDDTALVEQQAPTILVYIYFEDENEKLQILNNQPDVAAMTVALHITLENEIYLDAIDSYVHTNGNVVEDNIVQRNLVGLRQVNDGLTNTTMNTNSNGTDSNVLISNMNTDLTTAYDSFAKLNIMTEAVNDLSNAVPQIMLAQTNSGVNEKVWAGDRLTINYASGNDGGYFGISEITGTYRNQINAEFFGQNNIYGTAITGVYGNNFIYSKNNVLANDVRQNSFIHSEYNTFEHGDMSRFDFIHSNRNIIRASRGSHRDQKAFAENISLYNSNYNVIHPQYHTYTNSNNEVAYLKGMISKAALINSNYNYIKGRSCIPFTTEENYEPNLTFINSLSSFYNLNNNYTVTMIGSNLSWINNTSGNIIGIGEGLIQDVGEGDRILLGHYNRNTKDPNDVLVIGDGRINKKWVKGQVSAIPNWHTDIKEYEKLMKTFSAEGSTAKNANYYRHNIFTVNKEGYITISDYDTNQSARYGFSGISAFDKNGKVTYDIPFETVYNQLNITQTYTDTMETFNLYENALMSLTASIPKTQIQYITNKAESNANTIFSAYINPTANIPVSVNSSACSVNADNHAVVTFNYYPVKNNTTHSVPTNPLCLIWYVRHPQESTFTQCSALVQPFNTKRLIMMKADVMNSISFSGFVEVQ